LSFNRARVLEGIALIVFASLFNRSGPNYREVVGRFTVRRTNGDLLGVMEPSRRTFPARNMATTEAALMRRGMSQIYLSLGDPAADGTVPVRLYFKPLVLLIWLGALIMFVGGGLSLSDRRLRGGRAETNPSERRHAELACPSNARAQFGIDLALKKSSA